MKKYSAESILIFVTLIWGATFAIIKLALVNVSPLVFITIRFSFATILLLPFFFKKAKNISRIAVLSGLLLGVMYFLGFSTQTIGLKYTTATKSGFITGTFILFTPIFQYLFEKKVPGKGNLIGISFVLTGLIMLSSQGNSILDIFTEIGSGFNIGDFFTLLCAVFYAMYLVYLDIISKKYDYMLLVFLQISVTAVLGIIAAITLHLTGLENIKFIFGGNLVFAFLYTSILATVLATTLQTKYQKVITPTKAGIIFSFEPIFSAVIAYYFINEKVSRFSLIGGILIFTGLLVTELFDKLIKNNE
ncbi:MAG: DMT family transporter [Ignavibacteriaceae bacterium]|nr:DMT family transporter [Ignavibacteriaceae bacterium]